MCVASFLFQVKIHMSRFSFETHLAEQNIPYVFQSAPYRLQTRRNTKIRPQMNSDLVSCATEMQSLGPLYSACLMRAADKLNINAYCDKGREVGGGGQTKKLATGACSLLALSEPDWLQGSATQPKICQQQWLAFPFLQACKINYLLNCYHF